jgi:hypothetical protein
MEEERYHLKSSIRRVLHARTEFCLPRETVILCLEVVVLVHD